MFDDYRARRAMRVAKVTEQQARLSPAAAERYEKQQREAAAERILEYRRWRDSEWSEPTRADIVERWPITGPKVVDSVDNAKTFAGAIDGAVAARKSVAPDNHLGLVYFGSLFTIIWVTLAVGMALVMAFLSAWWMLGLAPSDMLTLGIPADVWGMAFCGLISGAIGGYIALLALDEKALIPLHRRRHLKRALRVSGDENYSRRLHEWERVELELRVTEAERVALWPPSTQEQPPTFEELYERHRPGKTTD